ncbi:helix-turn-helix domain-containing protein [Alkalihalobacillus sp. AL-G]|uniref:helix-turn-helix domain-containing protein n=1 Tax=Alkalihalobacillus sp. AL-G TaxID=2926399 RepID=UPI00272A4CF1|nr:XRE family transcriptional regulator [Alkalihalobacillus sp. AL-G]WLD94147.1 XRE family transcriptional regulator [Alkalihalobacillus sp. AL-G]
MSQEVNQMIGDKIRTIRRQRNLSLEEMSRLTDVSKAMLGQIERGVSSPTVSTLWKVASGLGVSFSSFVEEEKPKFSKVEIDNVEPLLEDEGRYQVRTLFPTEAKRRFEAYSVTLEPDCIYTSSAHGDGVEEYLFVHEGEMTLTVAGETHRLRENEAFHFSANYEHIYENTTDERCTLLMVIYYP